MEIEPQSHNPARKKLTQVFRYIEALNQLRNPVTRSLDDQLWLQWFKDLPDHASIKRGVISEVVRQAPEKTKNIPKLTDEEIVEILTIRRPQLTKSPTPPVSIADWLEFGWDKIDVTPTVRPSKNEINEKGETITIQFSDSLDRVGDLGEWTKQKASWADAERPARAAMKIFETIYELHGRIEREAERVELVLGDGILSWRRSEGDIFHPILLQRVQLLFDPSIPEFKILETDHPPELYTSLFRSLVDVDGRVISRCREELEAAFFHPLEGEGTTGFLKRVVTQLSPHGELLENRPSVSSIHDSPSIYRSPVLFLRTRNLGFASAIDSVLEDIHKREDLPKSILKIVGISETPIVESEDAKSDDLMAGSGNEDQEILLSKPANPEQLQIAQQLERHGCVLVQGPPGTGKTHTIANLIGHLLAQGKRILVTSHTTKALRVVRDQVVTSLRPLCVSVLESDSASRKQLEESITGIVQRLSKTRPDLLAKEAEKVKADRDQIISKLKAARQEMLAARSNEYRDVILSGSTFSPAEAARIVRDGTKQDGWIPSPVELGKMLTLTETEVGELYLTNSAVRPDDESELTAQLPDPDSIPSPAEFSRWIEMLDTLDKSDFTLHENLWDGDAATNDPKELEVLLESLIKAADLISNAAENQWRLCVVDAGMRGGTHTAVWKELLDLIQVANHHADEALEYELRYAPSIQSNENPELIVRGIDEIIVMLASSKKDLSTIQLLLHPSWKRIASSCKVNGQSPKSETHFQALRKVANLKQLRHQLMVRWQRQMTAIGGPTIEELGVAPEKNCAKFIGLVEQALAWQNESWAPLMEIVKRTGLKWDLALQLVKPDLGQFGDLSRLRKLISEALPDVFAARCAALRIKELREKLSALGDMLSKLGGTGGSAHVVKDLRDAIISRSNQQYLRAFDRLVDLRTKSKHLTTRHSLLSKLEKVAPTWASSIRNRKPPHDQTDAPGDVLAAWRWRQLQDELEKRASVALDEIQKRIDSLGQSLYEATARLIELYAWSAQAARTGHEQHQALVGWLQMMTKIGKGTGKRVPRLLAEARQLLRQSRASVPVWVMPISRVVDSFDPSTTRFDVVIIDEASQCDLMGLIPMYMAEQVIVVGDNEQVSPDAVGQRAEEVQHLIDEHLQGIPNSMLYDGQLSIYDLAMQAFGGAMFLREHFRCVPDIIQFSNHHSYQGKITPLRDASEVLLRPYVVAYRVRGQSTDDQQNTEEAEAIGSLLIACCEQPEYAEKSFGVISLVGEQQAMLIDSILRKRMAPMEYEKRRVICGNAAQFQGDEREVMFLSMVDSPLGGPLAMRDAGPRNMFKKRFNVAASRAKDQMWVVYSLDNQVDLKPGDLRRSLIEHALDPQALTKKLASAEARAESEFERLVIQRLVTAGFKVKGQHRVGYYRIDMVVQGNGKQLAVECDGDRYHPIEKLGDDMARQAILERLSWRFERIRGSVFFRDPERALKPVFERLKRIGIGPLSGDSGSTEEPATSELRERVVRRAQELRAIWTANGNEATATSSTIDQAPLDLKDEAEDDEEESQSTGSRNINSIDQDDLRQALYACLSRGATRERSELSREVVQKLGFTRLGRKIQKRINRLIGTEIRAGRLRTDSEWQKVTRL